MTTFLSKDQSCRNEQTKQSIPNLSGVHIIKDTLSLITFDTKNQGTLNSQINIFSLKSRLEVPNYVNIIAQ